MKTIRESIEPCNLTEIRKVRAAISPPPYVINRYDCNGGAINYQVQQDGGDSEVISNIVDDEVKRAKGTAAFIVAAPGYVDTMARELEEWRSAWVELFNAEVAIDPVAIRAAQDRLNRLTPTGKP